MKILLLEDNSEDIEACKNSVETYCYGKTTKVDLVITKTIAVAEKKLDGSFDGAIIDLKLGHSGNEGNEIIRKIDSAFFRIPIIIMTGTPDSIDRQFNYLSVCKKGETTYEKIFDQFRELFDTGITRILGGRGIIEKTLNDVYKNCLIPRIKTWKQYAKQNPEETEQALLRLTINHIMQYLDDGKTKFFPEEVYLSNPESEKIVTGGIFLDNIDQSYQIVLNPACDLVIRSDGKFKTEQILTIQIEPRDVVIKTKILNPTEKKKKEEIIKNLVRNNFNLFYHYLPKTESFQGGFLNFRKIKTFSIEDFEKVHTPQNIQISPQFTKDIQARFSSYYGRQGQPELDEKSIIKEFI